MKICTPFILAITFIALTFKPTDSSAQPFYNYQSITQHTLFFSFSWDQELILGVGYGYRKASTKFTEISFEFSSPLAEFYKGENYQIRFNSHSRLTQRRPLISLGPTIGYEKTTNDNGVEHALNVGFNVLPGYQILASLSDGPSAVLGARASYENKVFSSIKAPDNDESDIQIFNSHTLTLSPHFDVMIKRSLGLSLQPKVVNTWNCSKYTYEEADKWEYQGSIYIGPSYWLRRN